MNDHPDFEARLATAFAIYADRAPVEVDPVSMTAIVAHGRRGRARLVLNLRASRLAVAALFALLAIGAALLAGAYLRPLLTDRAVVRLAELQSPWTSIGTRQWQFQNGSHFIPLTTQVDMVISPGGITYSLQNTVSSSASLSARGTLVVTLLSAFQVCKAGDTGTYELRLSPGGQEMTLELVSDACPRRAGILAGVWTRTDVGPLAAGRHESRLYRPFGPGSQLSYVVPSGWEESGEFADGLGLHKLNDPADLRIEVAAGVVPASLGGSHCNDTIAGAGSTPLGISDWLTNRPNLQVAGHRTLVSIGGLSGVVLDLTVRPNDPKPSWGACPFFDGQSGNVTLAYRDAPGDELGFHGLTSNHLILLDRGDGRTMAIVIEADSSDGWETGLAEAMGILQSFEFTR